MPDLVYMALVLGLAIVAWRVCVTVFRIMDGSDGLPAVPVSRDTPEESLRRAKRRRVRAEHDFWDAEFAASSSRRLCSCGSPAHRSRN